MIPSSLLKPRFLEVRLERQKRAEELAVVRMQVRTQIANQISNSLILINAGGLAAAIAWVQALPLESDNALQYSCTDVLLNTLPGAGALLLLGILATVVSYVISYAIVGSERRAVLWALGLFAAVLCAVSAAGWTGYTVLNCKSIALDQRIGREVMLSLAAYQQAQTEEERRELFDDLKRRDYKARAKLELATIEAEHRQIAELETMLSRVRELRAEFIRRTNASADEALFASQLNRLSKLEAELENLIRRQALESRAPE